jgi:heme a synthase
VERHLPKLAVANLVANIIVVVTGGAVRLTGSGLGCPTWPQCTEGSYVPHGSLGVHGAIEFGNRAIGIVVALVAIACWVAARKAHDRRALRWATIIALGIPAQAVLGGITVLTKLNPWIVGLHMLVSMAIVGACVVLVDHVSSPARPAAHSQTDRTSWLVFGTGWVVLYLGTVVTGSGPHSGDLKSHRTGLDPQVMSHVHASAVYALVAFTLGLLVVALRHDDKLTAQLTAVLLFVEISQGAVGFIQYFLDLPEALVALHMLGAALVSAALTAVVLGTRQRV